MTFRVVVILLCLGIAAQAADQTIVLKAARLFDGKSNALVQNAVVIVQGDKIVDAGSNLPIPSDAHHLHFGLGQTETRLELPPGRHTLQLLLGDDRHIPFDPPLYSQKITIIVPK